MNTKERSMARNFDPDTAPDLSRDGWPEKFAKAVVRRSQPSRGKQTAQTTPLLPQSQGVTNHLETAKKSTNA